MTGQAASGTIRRQASATEEQSTGQLQPGMPHDPPPQGDDEVIGRAFRWSLAAMALLACVVAGIVVWLRGGAASGPDRRTPIKSAAEQVAHVAARIPRVPLTDMTKAAGIDFMHVSGAEGELLFPEFMGAAVVLFDYDGDSDLDIFFSNGQYWPWATQKPANAKEPTHALYRNDGNWKFTDVSEQAGLKLSYYAMGAAAADYDNDGDQDLFVAAVGPNHLYRNDGGRFVDVTSRANVGGQPDEFSSGCGWFDYDRDGDLDLLVLNYIIWSRQINADRIFRLDAGGSRGAIRPGQFEGTYFYLYRNEGDGLFSDVSASSGIRVDSPNTKKPFAKGLGLCFTDLNADGWLDIVVANDTVRNFAYLNQRDGTFAEIGERLGIAYGPRGRARSGMGIDIADFRNDGTLGIAIGNFSSEMCALFVSSHSMLPESLRNVKLRFSDEAIAAGIGEESALRLTFGVFFFDVDLDGWQDLLLCNGHVDPLVDTVEGNQTYEQPPLLFWNCVAQGPCDFVSMKREHLGDDFFNPLVGRGAAFGDLDGDGDLDIVLTSTGGPVRLFRNDQALGHHFLRLKLVGKKSPRDAVGALIEVKCGGRVFRQRVSPVRSYYSQCESTVTFGLGQATQVEEVRIVWPSGNVQKLNAPKIDTLLVIAEELEGG
jgi:hypothetical protein